MLLCELCTAPCASTPVQVGQCHGQAEPCTALCAPPHVQVWDSATGKLKKDLTYQSEEMFMMHDEAVLCVNFSRDNELLVSGGRRVGRGGRREEVKGGRGVRGGEVKGGGGRDEVRKTLARLNVTDACLIVISPPFLLASPVPLPPSFPPSLPSGSDQDSPSSPLPLRLPGWAHQGVEDPHRAVSAPL